jgi:catechol 2,3-dioxygenase-like lactoylglutathione lyase family enzyme
MSHATLWVLDQEEARKFYVDKLGFDVRTDVTMDGGFRWLTVGPKGQPDLEIVLMEIKVGQMFDEATAMKLKSLVQAGKMGAGVFEADDCKATYEDLKKKGVEFLSPPTDRFYGIEAIMKDNSGNWFSLTQPKNG